MADFARPYLESAVEEKSDLRYQSRPYFFHFIDSQFFCEEIKRSGHFSHQFQCTLLLFPMIRTTNLSTEADFHVDML